MEPVLEFALEYARRGYAVFPAQPNDKRPAVEGGLKAATQDKTKITQWWGKGRSTNLALATGGLVALDIDELDKRTDHPRPNPWLENADPALRRLIEAAPSQTTPSGGKHYLFRQRPGDGFRNSAGKIAEGVDIRADGGYIVVAPSTIGGRPYQWFRKGKRIDLPPPVGKLPMLPDALAVMIQGGPPPRGGRPAAEGTIATGSEREQNYATAALQKAIGAVSLAGEGTRNDTLNKAAFGLGQLVGGGGLNEERAVKALLRAAVGGGLGESEALATIKSGLEAGKKEPRDVPSRRREGAPSSGEGIVWNVRAGNEIECSPPVWLWPGWVQTGVVNLVAAKGGGGKSFFTADLGARVTRGDDWPDGKGKFEKGKVLYIIGDGSIEEARFRFENAGGVLRAADFLEDGTDANGKKVRFNLAAARSLIQSFSGYALVVVDSINSFFGSGSDSYKSPEVYEVLSAFREYAETTKTAVLLVGHERKGGGGTEAVMGASGFVDFCRVVMQIRTDPKDFDRKRIWVTKINNAVKSSGRAFWIRNEPPKRNLSATLDDADTRGARPKAIWDTHPLTETFEEAVKADQAFAHGPTKVEKATEWLKMLLNGKALPVQEIKDRGETEGYSQATITRAGGNLGFKCPRGGPAVWGPYKPPIF